MLFTKHDLPLLVILLLWFPAAFSLGSPFYTDQDVASKTGLFVFERDGKKKNFDHLVRNNVRLPTQIWPKVF